MKRLFLALLCALGVATSGCSVSGSYNYSDSGKYTEYTGVVNIEDESLTALDLSWISGQVTIMQMGNKLSVKESDSNQNSYLPLYYYQNDNTFNIKYVKSGTDQSDYNKCDKTLELLLPLSIKTIKIDNVSSKVKLLLTDVDKAEINTVSGNIELGSEHIKKVNIDSVSGNVDVAITDVDKNEEIVIESVSGDVGLFLENSRGYDLKFKSVSGTKTLNFDGQGENKYSIDVETVSGDLSINPSLINN